jgi:hypothetical protein
MPPRYTFRVGELYTQSATYIASVVYDSEDDTLDATFVSLAGSRTWTVKITPHSSDDALIKEFDSIVMAAADVLVPPKEALSSSSGVSEGSAGREPSSTALDSTSFASMKLGEVEFRVSLEELSSSGDLRVKLIRGNRRFLEVVAELVPSSSSASTAGAGVPMPGVFSRAVSSGFNEKPIKKSASAASKGVRRLKSSFFLEDESIPGALAVLLGHTPSAVMQRLLGQNAAIQRDLLSAVNQRDKAKEQLSTVMSQFEVLQRTQQAYREKTMSQFHALLESKKQVLIELKASETKLKQDLAFEKEDKRVLEGEKDKIAVRNLELQVGGAEYERMEKEQEKEAKKKTATKKTASKKGASDKAGGGASKGKEKARAVTKKKASASSSSASSATAAAAAGKKRGRSAIETDNYEEVDDEEEEEDESASSRGKGGSGSGYYDQDAASEDEDDDDEDEGDDPEAYRHLHARGGAGAGGQMMDDDDDDEEEDEDDDDEEEDEDEGEKRKRKAAAPAGAAKKAKAGASFSSSSSAAAAGPTSRHPYGQSMATETDQEEEEEEDEEDESEEEEEYGGDSGVAKAKAKKPAVKASKKKKAKTPAALAPVPATAGPDFVYPGDFDNNDDVL